MAPLTARADRAPLAAVYQDAGLGCLGCPVCRLIIRQQTVSSRPITSPLEISQNAFALSYVCTETSNWNCKWGGSDCRRKRFALA